MEEEKKEQPEEEQAPIEAKENNTPEEPGIEEEIVDEEPTPEPEEFNIENKKEPEGEDITKDELTEVDKEIEKEEEEIKEEDEKLEEVNEEIKEDVKETEDVPEEVIETELEVEKENEPEVEKEEEVSDVDETQALIDEFKEKEDSDIEEKEKKEKEKEETSKSTEEESNELTTHIYALRTTANREDQVMDFVTSNAEKKKFNVYSVIKAHGMRGYIFVEADSKGDAEQAAFGVPYARGILPKEIDYNEIEHMLEQVKREVNIQQNDIVEIISGPFKRENAKIIRIDKGKEEVVVELLEAAVPIPITLKLDAVKVIRREKEEKEEENPSE